MYLCYAFVALRRKMSATQRSKYSLFESIQSVLYVRIGVYVRVCVCVHARRSKIILSEEQKLVHVEADRL